MTRPKSRLLNLDIDLQKKGRGYSTIHSVRGVLRPAFQMAFVDDLIRKNPFDFQLASVVVNDSVTREAVSRADMRKFLNFVKEYSHFCRYYEGIYILFHTGLRISEFAALHWNDIDDDLIHVDYSEHRLDYSDKPSEIVVGEPKNYKHRKIPMTDDIQALFNKVKRLGFNSLEGYVFCRKDGERCTVHSISSAVTRRADEAGIKKTSIHEIRRTVSSYLRQELPIKAVASMLGHLETTNEICYNYDMSEKSEKTRALTDLSSKLIKFCPESQKQKKTGSA